MATGANRLNADAMNYMKRGSAAGTPIIDGGMKTHIAGIPSEIGMITITTSIDLLELEMGSNYQRAKKKRRGTVKMRSIGLIGVVLLVLGLLAFVVPIPHSESHGVKIGDAKIGVQTQHSEKLPPVVGIILLVGGVVVLAVGARKA